jgi:hypothetical protein
LGKDIEQLVPEISAYEFHHAPETSAARRLSHSPPHQGFGNGAADAGLEQQGNQAVLSRHRKGISSAAVAPDPLIASPAARSHDSKNVHDASERGLGNVLQRLPRHQPIRAGIESCEVGDDFVIAAAVSPELRQQAFRARMAQDRPAPRPSRRSGRRPRRYRGLS